MKNLIVMLIMLVGLNCANAQQLTEQEAQQQRKEIRAEIQAMKVGYFTQELELTPQQSEMFWPLYNQYNKELRKVIGIRHKIRKELRNRTGTIEDINNWVGIDTEVSKLNKKYIPEFLKTISYDQIIRMFIAEESFKQELLQESKRRINQKERN